MNTSDNADDPVNRPIGYWVKHLHDLIEAGLDTGLGEFSLVRRQWQIMNLLSDRDHTRDQAEQALAPFWTDGAPPLDTLLVGPQGLVSRGWVEQDTGTGLLSLTEAGRAAHAAVAARVGEIRGRAMHGLTTEQYADTVRNLAVMAANLAGVSR